VHETLSGIIALFPTDPSEFNPYAASENLMEGREVSDPEFEPIEPASLWRRAIASLLDVIFILILFGICIATLFALSNSDKRIESFLLSYIDAIFVMIPLCTCMIYSTAMEASSLQATLGKLALGLKVCDTRGRRVTAMVVFAREVLKYPCIMFHVLTRGAELPFVTYHDSTPSPCLHDLLTRTRVLRVRFLKADEGTAGFP
jgi:uncharacterized RDD family membrane protein YckC